MAAHNVLHNVYLKQAAISDWINLLRCGLRNSTLLSELSNEVSLDPCFNLRFPCFPLWAVLGEVIVQLWAKVRKAPPPKLMLDSGKVKQVTMADTGDAVNIKYIKQSNFT
ncbi:hypothetical protein J6590_104161 [Homalodisca vitripennis]|nr:hypothetical protein J6590_104161 [Homalodisca vitripennis]